MVAKAVASHWVGRFGMRGLLLMSITGAVLYGLLVLTNHFLTQEKPEFTLSPNDHAAGADRTLRSWGTSLPALVVEPQQRLAEQSPCRGQPGCCSPCGS